MTTGVYAGSFDPVTNGHLWMIKRGADIFDSLVIAIGTNPDKKAMFLPDERLDLLRASTEVVQNIRIESFENRYLAEYARSVGASFILRGIRPGDFEYERAMRYVNEDLDSGITTVFLMPPRELAEVSSSIVKGLVGPVGWESVVAKYVSQSVLEKLKEKHDARNI